MVLLQRILQTLKNISVTDLNKSPFTIWAPYKTCHHFTSNQQLFSTCKYEEVYRDNVLMI
jgi:hypothetical protein